MAKPVNNLTFKLSHPVAFRINLKKAKSIHTTKVDESTEVKSTKVSKVPKELQGYTKVGSKQLAVVIKVDGIFKAKLTSSPVEETQELQVVPFTPRSLELRGKSCVFLKVKDERNRSICYMRSVENSKYNPGLQEQYDVLKEHIVISGHLYRKAGMLYFDYEKLVAFKENGAHLDEIMIESNL